MNKIIRRKYGNSTITIALVNIDHDEKIFEIEIFNDIKIVYNPTGLYITTSIASDKVEESDIPEFLADSGMSQKLNKIITEELSLCLRQIRNQTCSMFDFGL